MSEIVSPMLSVGIVPSYMLEFIQAPYFKATNIVGDAQQIIKVVPAQKGKYKMAVLPFDNIISQPANGCDWTPLKGKPVGVREIDPCAHEIQKEICPGDLDAVCADVDLLGQAQQRYSMLPAETQEVIFALLAQYGDGIANDINSNAWFGKNFSYANVAPFYANYANSTMTAEEQTAFQADRALCDGLWAEITQEVTAGTVAYVDSNDGTANGNALNPNNIVGFLQKLMNKAKTTLKRHAQAMFLLQPDLWDAYHTYLQQGHAQGNPEATKLLQNLKNDIDNGILTYSGKIVKRMDDWDWYDDLVGAKKDSTVNSTPITHSRNLRAIFTIPNNLTLVVDAQRANNSAYGLLVKTRADLKEKGKMDVFGAYKIGTGIRYIDMLVVGYNSSQTFQ